MGEIQAHPGTFLTAFVAILSTALLIAGVGGPDYLISSPITTNPPMSNVLLHYGLFRWCVGPLYGREWCTSIIDSDCTAQFAISTPSVTDSPVLLLDGSLCAKFNTTRGLLIISLILAAVTSFVLLIFYVQGRGSDLRVALFAFASGLFGLTSMAIAVNDFISGTSVTRGNSFGTAVAGWVLIFVDSFLIVADAHYGFQYQRVAYTATN